MPMGLIAAISKQSETVVKPIFTIAPPIVLPNGGVKKPRQTKELVFVSTVNPSREHSKIMQDESNINIL